MAFSSQKNAKLPTLQLNRHLDRMIVQNEREQKLYRELNIRKVIGSPKNIEEAMKKITYKQLKIPPISQRNNSSSKKQKTDIPTLKEKAENKYSSLSNNE